MESLYDEIEMKECESYAMANPCEQAQQNRQCNNLACKIC